METYPLVEPLKDRELEVLRLIADGLTNQEIAERLYISLNTLRWYNKQIYSKLGVHHRTKAINRARELGIFEETEQAPEEDELSFASKISLPDFLTSFVGREKAISQVEELLQTVRLLTIVGTAGVGKTRLAVHIANNLKEQFDDGVYFVSLAGLADANQMPNTVANMLGLSEEKNLSAKDVVGNFLREKQVLLILDNFEHILQAAIHVTNWLKIAPNLTVVITSREILRLYGEQVYQLDPLINPTSETPLLVSTQSESVQLFLDRARNLKPQWQPNQTDIEAIAKLCRYLEGLPLSIELAATRINMLSPSAMLDQLNSRLDFLVGGARNLPLRQQSLRRALAWSYDLLEHEERILFARLSIFRSGFSLESAEKICMEDLRLDCVGGLASLLDKSLLIVFEDRNKDPRFQMLESIREYAIEQLETSDELASIAEKHAHFYCQMSEQAYQERVGHRQNYWANRTEIEIDNLRTSLRHFQATGQTEMGLRLLTGIFWVLGRRGYVEESVHWYNYFLEKSDETVDIRVKILAMICLGEIARRHGQSEQAFRVQNEARLLAKAIEDKQLLGLALGQIASYGNEFNLEGTTPLELVSEAVDLLTEVHDIPILCWIHNLRGELYRQQNDFENARKCYELSLEIAEELHSANRIATSLLNLGIIALELNEYEKALDLIKRSLRQNLEVRNGNIFGGILILASEFLNRFGHYFHAAKILASAEIIRTQHGLAVDPFDFGILQRSLATIEANLDTELFQVAWIEGQAMDMQQTFNFAVKLMEDSIRNLR